MNEALKENGEFKRLPLSQIVLSNYNARKFVNMTPERQRKLDELVASVKEKGVIQPIAVRPIQDGLYEVMAGERRFRASQLANLRDIPVMAYEASDDEALDIMATENLQREDLTPREQAESFKMILDAGGNTLDAVKDLAKRVGVAPHAIRLRVALLKQPQPVLDAWNEGQITTAHVEQFTRISDENGILAALTECLRRRMTVKELAEFVMSRKPPMKAAKFDTDECVHCVSNGQNQGSLFTLNLENAVCANAPCFKAKQGAFIAENWATSKAHEAFKTNGYRFQEDLTSSDFVAITAEEPAERCLSCPEFVSIVTVVGTGVQGRACVGKRDCFDDLYALKATPKKGAKAKSPSDQDKEGEGEGKSPAKTQPAEKKGKVEPAAEELEKKAARRGETFRESFYKEAIPHKISSLPPNQPPAVRLAIIALALGSRSAQTVLDKKLGLDLHSNKEALTAKVFEMADADLLPTLQEMAVAPIMEGDSGYSSTSSPKIRDMVAHHIGIDLKAQWCINEAYIKALTKAEIVKMGEDPGVSLWDEEKVKGYMEEKFPKQGWMSLKKGDLIDCVMKSGVDLTGKVPMEIYGTGRAV